MPAIEDHAFLKVCAELASCLSISIASARRKVDLEAARSGIRDPSSRKEIAENLLKEVRKRLKSGDAISPTQLDELLKALAKDDNFMVED